MRRVDLAVMAKAPIPGQAKTRLSPLLGAVGAARLQGLLLQRTVAMAVVADIGPVHLWCAGPLEHPAFTECRAYGPVSLHSQPNGDLGQRMLSAVEASTASAGVVIVGTDCPALTPTLLREAAGALTDYDAVIIPADDGGYVLIGMRNAKAPLFRDINWGTEAVMQQTRERLEAMGWRWLELPMLWDVDRPEDFPRLCVKMPEAAALIRESSSPNVMETAHEHHG